MALEIPHQGDILPGVIVRIEAYGAFCRLRGPRGPQGLIHISQLANDRRVDNVEDVVSLNDQVWVKVLEVETDPSTQRWKIRLSRKDVSQDGLATDLAAEREMKEKQRDQLELNLNSMIGMGVARDPMADRLIMKNDGVRRGTTFRGGYSLVGDDEGEIPAAVLDEPTTTLAPLGRGRGSTLPAWMTEAKEGPTGESQSDDKDRARDKAKKKDERKDSRRKRTSSHKSKKRSHRTYDDNDSDSGSKDDERAPHSHDERKRRHRSKDDVKDERNNSEQKGRRRRSNHRKQHRANHSSDSSCDSRERKRHRKRSS